MRHRAARSARELRVCGSGPACPRGGASAHRGAPRGPSSAVTRGYRRASGVACLPLVIPSHGTPHRQGKTETPPGSGSAGGVMVLTRRSGGTLVALRPGLRACVHRRVVIHRRVLPSACEPPAAGAAAESREALGDGGWQSRHGVLGTKGVAVGGATDVAVHDRGNEKGAASRMSDRRGDRAIHGSGRDSQCEAKGKARPADCQEGAREDVTRAPARLSAARPRARSPRRPVSLPPRTRP